jgi:hypothetical protein
MPSTSKKQHNFMAAVAKNPGFAKKVGVPRSVGEEFLTADKGKKFKEGGTMKKMNPGLKAMLAKKKETPMKTGGKTMKKMAGGGLSAGHKQADGVAKKGKTKAKMIKMNYGGKC